jgi:hypothetical protein
MTTSTKELRRLVKEQWGQFVSDKGRVDEDGLIGRVRSLFLDEPTLVKMRASEEARRLYQDIKVAIEEVAHKSRVRAAAIRKTVGEIVAAGGPVQMPLPGLDELAAEFYTVPGEGKFRGDLLTRRQLRLVIAEYTRSIAEDTLKRARLLVVEASCAIIELAEEEPISKLWGGARAA